MLEEVNPMGTGYHHMTRDERIQLDALRRAGVPVAECAKQLGFCRQTIYNELGRGECDVVHKVNGYLRDLKEYSAEKGQQIHDRNQETRGRPSMKIGSDIKYANFLEEKILKDRFSPAAALAAARASGLFQTSVSVNTLYSYIDKGIFFKLTNKDLWVKGHRKKKTEQPERRNVHPKLPSIEDRPEAVNQRAEFGHWEMDLVVGCSRSKAALLTLTERQTRQEMIFKLPDKRAASVRAVFDRLERDMGRKRFRERFRSITTDNGSEFLEYDKLRQSIRDGPRFDIYYCHSYSAWEKGTNENHNRMIRRWFPKGTDFGKVTKRQIAAIQDWMNGYPRRILGWKTPLQAAL